MFVLVSETVLLKFFTYILTRVFIFNRVTCEHLTISQL